MWQKIKFLVRKSSALLLGVLILLIMCISVLVTALENEQNPQFSRLGDGLWWAFVTMSTTGYGDKVPMTIMGKVLAILVIAGGITVTSLLSGILASTLVRVDAETRKGFMKAHHKSNHIIICGWKRDVMAETVLHIMESNSQTLTGSSGSNMVIISNIHSSAVSDLKANPKLKNLHFVRGEYYEEHIVKSANIEQAFKIIILADTWENKSVMEIDARTVMAVLTIRALSKNAYIIAELYEKKYEQYLKQAFCNEIFYVEEFNKLMLGGMSSISGFGNIMMNIISQQDNVGITTEPVPQHYVSKRYGDVRKEIPHGNGRMMIGILEHVGNPINIKLKALQEAQKTSNINQLVENLQEAKNIMINHPVLLPNDDYYIAPNSMAIYLTKYEK